MSIEVWVQILIEFDFDLDRGKDRGKSQFMKLSGTQNRPYFPNPSVQSTDPTHDQRVHMYYRNLKNAII